MESSSEPQRTNGFGDQPSSVVAQTSRRAVMLWALAEQRVFPGEVAVPTVGQEHSNTSHRREFTTPRREPGAMSGKFVLKGAPLSESWPRFQCSRPTEGWCRPMTRILGQPAEGPKETPWVGRQPRPIGLDSPRSSRDRHFSTNTFWAQEGKYQ